MRKEYVKNAVKKQRRSVLLCCLVGFFLAESFPMERKGDRKVQRDGCDKERITQDDQRWLGKLRERMAGKKQHQAEYDQCRTFIIGE